MNNKKAGIALTILGLLLIAAALFLTLHNTREQSQAGENASEALEILEQVIPTRESSLLPSAPQSNDILPDYVIDPNMEMPIETIDGEDYIGKLEIPAIDRALPVISQWSYPNLKIAPCRYEGSAYLDNLIIAAHNYETHFGPIKNLRIGDRVTFTDTAGNVFLYQVVEVEMLDGTAIEEMSAGKWDLTLFTCTIGGVSRVTVRCERILS